MRRSPQIQPLSAVHLREALEAARAGDVPASLYHVMRIDNESWDGMHQRLNELGAHLTALLADSMNGRTP
ncbi:hypothetical protein [Phaeacidiphilus oryzae]|uniref:hypothetical protein n=1 Tax=Phaeacidiphilus oryzae TaxID=348818 RepID=UPI00056C9148|nr:hypothetical protein [Phaeacidiphilus oryzae]